MTQTSGGPTTDQGGASEPTKEERGTGSAGTSGTDSEKGGKPAPGGCDEASSAGDGSATGLDTAHDRAS